MDIKIGNKKIGNGNPVFVTAEISANHGQHFNRAINMIKKVKECGADAVKFQTYTPDTLTINANNRYFRIKHAEWGGQTLYELYKKAYTPWRWFKRLKNVAEDMGLIFFSTAFDRTSVDFLEELAVPAHKIASFELADLALIEYVAGTKKPLILSTGMASLSEIKEAVDTARGAGAKDIILLKCVSSYPAKPKQMNLNEIQAMRRLFNCPVGLSDHTLGTGAAIAAACLGARMIEKHFTLSRKIKTPDSFFSIEPGELKELTANIRIAQEALGGQDHALSGEEKKNMVFRRSLFAVEDIKSGCILTGSNVKSIRPGYGLPPKYFKDIIGKKAKRNIKKGTPLNWKLIEG